MTRLFALVLVACSGIVDGGARPLPTPADVETAQAATVRLSWPGGEARAGCTGVAVGPRNILTVRHCERPSWDYLTRAAWWSWGEPQPAQLVECATVRLPEGYRHLLDGTDGWCVYETAEELPAWLPVGDSCPGDAAAVHVGMGESHDWNWMAVDIHRAGEWWRVTPLSHHRQWQHGDSGGPIVCGGRVVGLAAFVPPHAVVLGQ